VKKVFGLFLMSVCAVGMMTAAFAKEKKVPVSAVPVVSAIAGEYYTQCNIWYTKADAIAVTNYHEGTLLPVNSKFKVTQVNEKEIVFEDIDSGTPLKILNVPKHNKFTMQKYFENYFGKKKLDLGKFTKEEKAAIIAGTVNVGMHKGAVLAAYGYPPSHATPDLRSTQWKYWVSRAGNFAVNFDLKGVVASVED